MLDLDFAEQHNSNVLMSQEDRRFLNLMKEGIHFEDGHYVMSLPFRNGPPVLPDNRTMAMHSFNSLKIKLLRDETYLSHYESFISILIKKRSC